ncbi:MAG: hypothetical protein Q4F67_12645 [Propionibacteriaceae bacterium]|nr:hypothetical protein [Propionibacteriaceae bacterium]
MSVLTASIVLFLAGTVFGVMAALLVRELFFRPPVPPRLRPAAEPENVEPVDPLAVLSEIREDLASHEREMARLEAAAVSAWDETVPALETDLVELTRTNRDLQGRLAETNRQLAAVTQELDQLRRRTRGPRFTRN